MVSAKVIALVLTVIMPGDTPDINHTVRQESFEACWREARSFVERDLSESLRSQGAIGLAAACAYKELPSEER